jgi:hypothetical protein
MTHTSRITPTQAADPPSRAAAIWLTVAQVAAVALLALALAWAVQPAAADSPARLPARPLQALLGMLGLAALVTALVPAWRRGAFTGAVCGAALAVACWFTADMRYWSEPVYGGNIPYMAFIMPGTALVLAAWGLIVRGGMKDGARLGVWALGAGLGLLLAGAFFFGIFSSGVHGLPVYQPLDGLSMYFYQYEQLLANLVLYPAAMWVGGIGLRARGGLAVQPLLTALAIGGALLWWNR